MKPVPQHSKWPIGASAAPFTQSTLGVHGTSVDEADDAAKTTLTREMRATVKERIT
jgi:hypothetical protein